MERSGEIKNQKPASIFELFNDFKSQRKFIGKKLKFAGVKDNGVYNVTSSFKVVNETFVSGRVEKREVWFDSLTFFFKSKEGVWSPANGFPIFKIEDPFVTFVNGEIVFGGVELYSRKNLNFPRFRTVFFR